MYYIREISKKTVLSHLYLLCFLPLFFLAVPTLLGLNKLTNSNLIDMKKLITLMVCLGTYFSVQAQHQVKDSIAIVKQINAMFKSWNSHDFSAMDNQ